MKTILILILLLLISCGKNNGELIIHETKNVTEIYQTCAFETLEDNILITCNEESILIPTYEPTVNKFELLDPCPEIEADFKELIIRVNDELLVFFKVGENEFLTRLNDGDYRTTDSRSCSFSVIDGEVVKE